MKDKLTVAVFALGCKTNNYETQQIMNTLLSRGYTVYEGLCKADIYVLNTCAVTAEAESKSRQAVSRVRKLNPDCKIIITGCASQKNQQQFADLPNVTAIIGNANKSIVADKIDEIGIFVSPLPHIYHHFADAVQSKTRAYVKIQEGCNNYCSYCIVPYLRGVSRSRDIPSIVKEINSSNAKEFVLLGIDISQYGLDIGVDLTDLLNALSSVKARIRLGSIYQDVITPSLLKSMENNVCRHLHLSMQSGCDKVLKSMNRHYTTEQFYRSVQLARQYYPDCGITTDIIVGFPTETEEDFAVSCEFVKRVNFSDIHIFPYSPRKGAKAYSMGKLDSKIVKDRVARLTAIKHQLKDSFIDKHIGQTMEVLVEEKKGNYYVGYTDNYIRVYIPHKVNINDLVMVTLKEKYAEGVIGI